jgi:hypothetical protein
MHYRGISPADQSGMRYTTFSMKRLFSRSRLNPRRWLLLTALGLGATVTACGSGGTSTLPAGISGSTQNLSQGGSAVPPSTAVQDGATTVRTVSAVNSASSVPTGISAAINAGGTAASGNWVADTDFSGGTTYSKSHAINTSSVTNPAAQAVYQTSRFGNFSYTIPGLTPSAAYTVRLHFAEPYWSAAGQRTFNVSINASQVLTNFDIFADSGGEYIADVKSFPATATAAGKIVLSFVTVTNNAMISGIEIDGAGAISSPSPSPSPSVSPTIGPSPLPSSFFQASAAAAPKFSMNPNPLRTRTCTDPCAPVLDARSSTFISNWFTSLVFPAITPAVPGNSSSTGYVAGAVYTAGASSYNYTWDSPNDSSFTGRIPNGARAEPNDWNIDVIDTTTNEEIGAFVFDCGSSSACAANGNGSSAAVSNGAPNPIWSQNIGAMTSTCFATRTCKGGAAGLSWSNDMLDPVELLHQSIPHMLEVVGDCVSSAAPVYPASGSDGAGPSGCPPEGEILWLDKTDAQIEAMAQPRWIKTLYHNLHDFGWIEGDTKNGSTGPVASLRSVSDLSWTAIGLPSQWTLMVDEMKAEGDGPSTVDNPPYYQVNIAVDSSIKTSNLHWLQYNSNH